MQRTAEDFKNAVAEKNIKEWAFRECGICHHPLYYSFSEGQVLIDTNCDCVSYHVPPRIGRYEELADMYNQSNDYWKKVMDDFFGIKTQE